jgi:muconolactone delta-isomerase
MGHLSARSATMLFFVKAELRRDASYDRLRWLGLVASTWEQIKQLEADGRVVAGGAFVGQNAGCVIADMPNHEELSQLINRLPVSAMVSWDVIPMIPADSALQAAKWALGQAAPAGNGR